jgi:uncharacterized protein (AIM24 family)
MSQIGDVDVSCDLDCGCATCCCAGFGCCRQKLAGTKGSVAFLAAGGTVVYRNLRANETITVNSRSVVAIEDSVRLGITPTGRIGMCCCGGEGYFATTLTGPGKIFLQVRCAARFLCIKHISDCPLYPAYLILTLLSLTFQTNTSQ